MPVLAISQKDLRPLLDDPSSMDKAIDVIERGLLSQNAGANREGTLLDRTQAENPNRLQVRHASEGSSVSGIHIFAEEDGGPERPNARFIAVLDPTTRQLLALVDYWNISPLRVGATAGMGVRYLAPAGAKTAAILGSAKQARGTLWAIKRAAPTIERARVFSPTPEHRERYAQEMSAFLGIPVEAVTNPKDAVEGADIVGVASTARQPVFEMPWVKPGALVATISYMGELPPLAADGPRLVASDPSTVLEREPYKSRLAAGEAPDNIVMPFVNVLLQKEDIVRQSANDIVVFDAGRLTVWAMSVAEMVYRWAAQRGVGTAFNLSDE